MAARAAGLGDVGDSAPEHWEKPLGSPDVHVVITAISPDERASRGGARARARRLRAARRESTAIWRQDCHVLPDEREPFGFKDGISHPAIEGSGIPGTNPHERPLKAGEFVLGYPDEMSDVRRMIPQPDVLGTQRQLRRRFESCISASPSFASYLRCERERHRKTKS